MRISGQDPSHRAEIFRNSSKDFEVDSRQPTGCKLFHQTARWPAPYQALDAPSFLLLANSTSFPPLDLSGRLVRGEARRKTHSFSIDSERGKVVVLDITTGSEFLRIITMPNGSTIAASGWVNQWDEEQVRQLVVDQRKGTINVDQ
jgi:hypothetical protein